MFIDEATVSVKAGDGGRGCVSFRREKFEPWGGPNGGDGGRGGDVVIRGNVNTGDLSEYRFRAIFKARNGEPGRGSDQHGRGGADCLMEVPPGTVISDAETGQVVAEVLENGQEIVLCKGGNGGWGNIHFKTSTNRAPRRANDGAPGEQGRYRLVLKTIADVGLVGFPNAGKSSLVSLLTSARPRTAAYPFTTLHPHVGVAEYERENGYERIFVADIPGLIEGASENRGLGHRFLRHIERCRILLLILDVAGVDQRAPWDDYETLIKELGLYSSALLEKPRLIAANKMDIDNAADNLKELRRRLPNLEIIPISCKSGEGIQKLKNLMLEHVRRIRDSSTQAASDTALSI